MRAAAEHGQVAVILLARVFNELQGHIDQAVIADLKTVDFELVAQLPAEDDQLIVLDAAARFRSGSVQGVFALNNLVAGQIELEDAVIWALLAVRTPNNQDLIGIGHRDAEGLANLVEGHGLVDLQILPLVRLDILDLEVGQGGAALVAEAPEDVYLVVRGEPRELAARLPHGGYVLPLLRGQIVTLTGIQELGHVGPAHSVDLVVELEELVRESGGLHGLNFAELALDPLRSNFEVEDQRGYRGPRRSCPLRPD